MSVKTACLRCQTPLDAGAQFCQVCGLSVSGEQTAPLPTLLQLVRQATLGEYEVLQEVGQGGMATVYLAHEIALDRKVAIKVMSPQFLHGAEMIERFKREARTAASLNHPHIIPIYSVRQSDQLVYFVMKYISGRSLEAILRDAGPLPFPMVRSILVDVGAALDFAHRQGVVHRDVKPGNIMIDEEGFAVITDFGIARAAEGESLTRSGTTVGTPSYLSPESCSGDLVGPAADQYSLGIVGYEMITGQLPFTADSSLGMMYAQVHAAPRPSDQFRPDCPPELRAAVTRMLQKAPGDRFPSLKEAVQAISGGRTSGGLALTDDNVRGHIGLLATPRPARPPAEGRRTPSSPAPLPRVSPSPASRRRRRRIRMSRIAGGLLLAGVGAGATWFTLQQREAEPTTTDSLPTQLPHDDIRADSMLLVARGGAEYARLRAVASAAAPAAIAAGDSLMSQAESLAAAGQKADAAILITRATSLWAAAVPPTTTVVESIPPTADSVPLAVRTPATPPVAKAEGDSTPAPAASDSLAVVEFYGELQRAIESRQLGEVARLLPNLTDSDLRDWRSLFNDDDIRFLSAPFQVLNVTRDGELLYARVRSTITITRYDGKVERKRRSLDFVTLTLGPRGWRQIRAQPVK